MITLDFPGGPVVRTLSFLCSGLGFDPWGTKIPYATPLSQKKREQFLNIITYPVDVQISNCLGTLMISFFRFL